MKRDNERCGDGAYNNKEEDVTGGVSPAPYAQGGFYFDKTPSWLNWTRQVSFINHAYTLLLKIQFPGGEFSCGQQQQQVQQPVDEETTDSRQLTAGGDKVSDFADASCTLREAGLLTFVDMEDGVGVNVGALVAILAGMRLLAYFALRFLSLKP